MGDEDECVICHQSGCRYCMTSNGLCTKCFSQIPPQFKYKYWVWSHLMPIIAFITGLAFLSWAAYELQPWPQLKQEAFFALETGWKTYLGLLTGFILFFTTILFPKIARKKYRRWMEDDRNVAELEKQIKEYYQDSNKNAFNNSISIKKVIKFMILLVGLFGNGFIFWQFFTEQIYFFAESNPSLDLIFAITLFVDILIPFLVFYKEKYNNKGARVIQILRIGLTNVILLGLVIVFGAQLYIIPSFAGFFDADANFVSFLFDLHHMSAMVLFGAYIWLILDLLIVDPILAKNNPVERDDLETSVTFFQKLAYFGQILIRPLFWIIIGILYLAIVAGGTMFVVGDYFMLISFFSVTISIGLVFPTILWLWQLYKHPLVSPANRNKKHKNVRAIQRVGTIGIVFGIILLSPIIFVPVYTHPSLDQQFSNQFGPDWEAVASSKTLQFGNLRSTKYSFYDNLFPFNFTANSKINVPYMIDHPPRVKGNNSIIEHTFYFDAYLPPQLQFGNETNNSTYASLKLPVIILMHGEVEEKGAWNANMTSQYLARQGYLVCDMNYGYLHTTIVGANNTGYYLTDLVRQIGTFTKFLAANAEYYHADMNKIYFAGRHLGGGLALLCGIGYNTTLSSLFAPNMNVKGIIPFYPVSDIGTEETFLTDTMPYYGEGYLPGSANSSSPDYNPDWINYNPLRLLEKTNSKLAPIFFITGTHDFVIPMRYTVVFLEMAQIKKIDIITGFYLLGNDGFDGAFFSPYGQSIIYYLERFLLLTH
jgi:acetyl esterase/lipase